MEAVVTAAGKESGLVIAALLYAQRCWQEGDRHALRQMNFGAREISAIAGLHLDDIARAEQLGAHCLDIRLNRDAFWSLLSGFERLRQRDELRRELISRDAPFDMMTELLGTGAREYSRWRRVYGMPTVIGRPPALDEATEHAIWRCCEGRMAAADQKTLCAKDYLEIALHCDESVRSVWRALAGWREAHAAAPLHDASRDSDEEQCG